jgi:Uma2 family endonuclease
VHALHDDTGCSRNHACMTANIATSLLNQLADDGPCEAFGPDLFLTADDRNVFLPDASVRNADGTPVAIFEVLLPGTAEYDLGRKAQHYRRQPSLRHLVLVWQDRIHVMHFHRKAAGDDFILTDLDRVDVKLSLDAIAVELPMIELYRRVVFR